MRNGRPMIAVVDFGMGNLRSVAKAVEHVAGKASVVIATTAAQVDAAERVVFPGQGAMPDCMQHLRDCGMEEAVRRAAACKPLLAVCIGEQMLFDASEETRVPGRPTPGLGLFRGQVLRFRDADLAQPGGRRPAGHVPDSTASIASPSPSRGTRRFVPRLMVTGRSVVSRSVRQGIPR
jgi:glutamine amidotransferase